jgi:hypothetical protein
MYNTLLTPTVESFDLSMPTADDALLECGLDLPGEPLGPVIEYSQVGAHEIAMVVARAAAYHDDVALEASIQAAVDPRDAIELSETTLEKLTALRDQAMFLATNGAAVEEAGRHDAVIARRLHNQELAAADADQDEVPTGGFVPVGVQRKSITRHAETLQAQRDKLQDVQAQAEALSLTSQERTVAIAVVAAAVYQERAAMTAADFEWQRQESRANLTLLGHAVVWLTDHTDALQTTA